jgi:hypothetical protein
MSKNIKDYTPGLNDFLHFAEVMNKNAQMDMKKSPAATAGGVSSAPLAQGMAGKTPTMSGAQAPNVTVSARGVQVSAPTANVGAELEKKNTGITGGTV